MALGWVGGLAESQTQTVSFGIDVFVAIQNHTNIDPEYHGKVSAMSAIYQRDSKHTNFTFHKSDIQRQDANININIHLLQILINKFEHPYSTLCLLGRQIRLKIMLFTMGQNFEQYFYGKRNTSCR